MELDKERKSKKQIQSKKIVTSSEKTQLQQILADCIIDMKKEIYKRKMRNLKYTPYSSLISRASQPELDYQDEVDFSRLSSNEKK